jgi:hypothetical protein
MAGGTVTRRRLLLRCCWVKFAAVTVLMAAALGVLGCLFALNIGGR